MLPERVGKVKPELRRSGWELSTFGRQAAVGQTSTPAWAHGIPTPMLFAVHAALEPYADGPPQAGKA